MLFYSSCQHILLYNNRAQQHWTHKLLGALHTSWEPLMNRHWAWWGQSEGMMLLSCLLLSSLPLLQSGSNFSCRHPPSPPAVRSSRVIEWTGTWLTFMALLCVSERHIGRCHHLKVLLYLNHNDTDRACHPVLCIHKQAQVLMARECLERSH